MHVKEAIALAAHVVGKTAGPVPLLAYLRVAKGRIIANDTAQQIDIPLELAAFANEDFCVHAGRFLRVLNALPAEAELKLEHKKSRLRVAAGPTSYELGTLPGDDYPPLSHEDHEVEVVALAKDLVGGLTFAAKAMAVKDVRYYLNGVHFELIAGKLVLTGTDGNRLHRARVELQDVDLKAKAEGIIAAPSVARVIEVAERHKDVTLQLAPTRLIVIDKETLSTKLVDGKFPSADKVIPSSRPSTGGLPRKSFAAAVHRVAQIFTGEEKAQGIRFGFARDAVTLAAENAEQDKSSERFEWNAADQDFKGIELGMDWHYVADALEAIEGDWAFVHLPKETNESLYITDGPSRELVIMPMRM